METGLGEWPADHVAGPALLVGLLLLKAYGEVLSLRPKY